MTFLLYLLSLVSIPLSADAGWMKLKFDSGKPNETHFSDNHLTIKVRSSASPIVYMLDSPKRVKRVIVIGKVSGKLDFKADDLWKKKHDDALLRVDVVESGGERLNAIQRAMAPEWLTELDEKAGKHGGGVASLRSFLLLPDAACIGRERVRPDFSLIQERVAAAPDSDGSFKMEIHFAKPVKTAGFWLQADGDDTSSSFEVQVDKLSVEYAEE